MARRSRFVAMALASAGLVASTSDCGGQTDSNRTDGSAANGSGGIDASKPPQPCLSGTTGYGGSGMGGVGGETGGFGGGPYPCLSGASAGGYGGTVDLDASSPDAEDAALDSLSDANETDGDASD